MTEKNEVVSSNALAKSHSNIFDADHPEKPIPKVEHIDYSGAHEKTDPKEIALVKKLDRWIMVRQHLLLHTPYLANSGV